MTRINYLLLNSIHTYVHILFLSFISQVMIDVQDSKRPLEPYIERTYSPLLTSLMLSPCRFIFSTSPIPNYFHFISRRYDRSPCGGTVVKIHKYLSLQQYIINIVKLRRITRYLLKLRDWIMRLRI